MSVPLCLSQSCAKKKEPKAILTAQGRWHRLRYHQLLHQETYLVHYEISSDDVIHCASVCGGESVVGSASDCCYHCNHRCSRFVVIVILTSTSIHDVSSDVGYCILLRTRLRSVVDALAVASTIVLAAEHNQDSSGRSDMRVVDLYMAEQLLVYNLLVLECSDVVACRSYLAVGCNCVATAPAQEMVCCQSRSVMVEVLMGMEVHAEVDAGQSSDSSRSQP
jgi:hypothetical protein